MHFPVLNELTAILSLFTNLFCSPSVSMRACVYVHLNLHCEIYTGTCSRKRICKCLGLVQVRCTKCPLSLLLLNAFLHNWFAVLEQNRTCTHLYVLLLLLWCHFKLFFLFFFLSLSPFPYIDSFESKIRCSFICPVSDVQCLCERPAICGVKLQLGFFMGGLSLRQFRLSLIVTLS